MSEIVKGVLQGGWSLLVGWILPSALNLLFLGLVVVPQLDSIGPVGWLRSLGSQEQAVALLVAAVVLGLILAAVQTPLYRLLEGYIGWNPQRPGEKHRWLRSPISTALDKSRQRQLRRKQVLLGRLDLVELSDLEANGNLRDELKGRLAEVRKDRRLDRYAEADAQRSATQRELLRGQVARYPVDDDQVVPTRLGNAIRRLEEYGYNRYLLDSQNLWYELYAQAPEPARKQVDQARATIDLLVCLLYGNLLVAALSLAAAVTGIGPPLPLLLAAGILIALAHGWYRTAVATTDDWAAATRALVNLGRVPMASGLGFKLPPTLDDERAMWAAVARLSARPHDERSNRADQYRAAPPPPSADSQP